MCLAGRTLLAETKRRQEQILADIPSEAINCGAFLIEPSSVRTLLADKQQVGRSVGRSVGLTLVVHGP